MLGNGVIGGMNGRRGHVGPGGPGWVSPRGINARIGTPSLRPWAPGGDRGGTGPTSHLFITTDPGVTSPWNELRARGAIRRGLSGPTTPDCASCWAAVDASVFPGEDAFLTAQCLAIGCQPPTVSTYGDVTVTNYPYTAPPPGTTAAPPPSADLWTKIAQSLGVSSASTVKQVAVGALVLMVLLAVLQSGGRRR